MRAIMAAARRIIVLDHGQKMAEGSPKEVISGLTVSVHIS
jgi:branched-chain amino acid transport system ATP-binding protein